MVAPPEPVADSMRALETRLRGAAGRSGPQLTRIAVHVLDAGGSRLRPRLVLSSAVAAGGAEAVDSRVLDAAAAVELLHLASLYHDDVLDCASVRRGHESANAVWGDRAAVLAGDALLSCAFDLAAGLRRNELCRFAQTVREMCDGQIAEARTQFEPRLGMERYEATIRAKTAALLACACWLGGSTAGADGPVLGALERFGCELGVAFQVVDDVLDLCADDSVTGKEKGTDLRQGVLTLPVLLALEDDPALAKLLVDHIDPKDVEQVGRRVRACGAHRRALEIAASHLRGALAALSSASLLADGERLLASIARSVFDPVERLGLLRA